MMNDLEESNELKKSRNVWLIVAIVALLGAILRWLGVYGEGPGTINWLTIIMFIVAMLIAIIKHIKIDKITV